MIFLFGTGQYGLSLNRTRSARRVTITDHHYEYTPFQQTHGAHRSTPLRLLKITR